MAKINLSVEIDNVLFGDYRLHVALFSGDNLTQLLEKEVAVNVPGVAPSAPVINDPVVTVS